MRQKVYLFLLLSMLVAPLAVIGYKLLALDFSLSELIPTVSYRVELAMRVHSHGEAVNVSTYLPRSDARQTISDETNDSAALDFSVQSDALNREALWQAASLEGEHTLRYSFAVQAKHVRYRIPDTLKIRQEYPKELAPYLAAEPGVEVDDPLIAEALRKLAVDKDASLLTLLTRIHRHLQDKFANKNFSGFTTALTALKLGEASCNGKSRLFVAFARHLGVPARLVGGLILERGTKRVSHQWTEVYIDGYWVPFDTINDHFAELPANFLTLYYGDLNLFKHTANVNFQYDFTTVRQMVARRETKSNAKNSMLHIANFYAVFEKIGISQNLLKILLMLPLGALVTVVFRNVIGVETFGTFLPALIAAAARESGLLWGMIGFLVVILASYGIRRLLDWLHLLHSPKMAILLTSVVIMLLSITVFGVQANLRDLAHISLFPIAILAITGERLAIIETEQGVLASVRITAVTLMVIAACYVVMDSLFLQNLILAFPELLLVVIALNLWLGKWVGMRVTEYVRFRHLLAPAGDERAAS